MSWFGWIAGAVLVLLGTAYATESMLEARDRTAFPPPGRMVDIGGRKLHLLCKGSAPGPTVVIEQGAGSPSILWWPIQNQVAAFARVCTYDRAGYQWSDNAARQRSLEDRVADLHKMLTAAAVPGPYVLVAHSFGGPLVRLFARDYPDQVAGMVLVDTPEEAVIFRPSYQGYTAKMGWMASAAEVAARFGIVRFALRWMVDVPDGFTPADFAALKAMIARPDFFRAMVDDPAALSRVKPDDRRSGGFGASLGDKPLVVLEHGQKFPGPAAVLEDGWTDGQKRLAALSTRSELIVAAKSNHMIQSDEPQLVVDAIRRVVEQVRQPAAALSDASNARQ
jgi:pimeloyl-ACP methyl ester carboxylesterase